MEILTILFIVISVQMYLASQVLKRKGLTYMSMIISTLALSQTLIDKTLFQSEQLVQIMLPMALLLMSAIAVATGRNSQW